MCEVMCKGSKDGGTTYLNIFAEVQILVDIVDVLYTVPVVKMYERVSVLS